MRRTAAIRWIPSCILVGFAVAALAGASAEPAEKNESDSTVIADLIDECLDVFAKTSETAAAGLETAGCTLSHDGEVSLVGGTGLSGDPILALKSAIEKIHGLDKYAAITSMSRVPFETTDGRHIMALRFHAETAVRTCLEIRLPYTEGATEAEVAFDADEVMEKKTDCIFWQEKP